jgi:hypothetical protein
MPNGDTVQPREYNPAWCKEKHRKIDEQLESVWAKFRRQDNLLWGILLALVGNLGGVIATLVSTLAGGA